MINWINDYGINEQLHFFAQEISSKYSSLYYRFPNHLMSREWAEKANSWRDYDVNLKDLVIESEEEAELEVDRLVQVYKKAMSVYKSLINHE